MLVFDLQLTLFIVLLLLLAIIWAIWLISRNNIQIKDEELSAWNTFPFGIILLSASNRPRFINRKAEKLLQSSLENIEEHTENSIDSLLQKIDPNEGVQHFTYAFDKQKSLDIWVGPIGATRFVLVQDLNAKRQQEIESHLYWSSVSHELRTPLTSILSHLEVSRSQSVPEEIQQHSLEIVHQQTQRLNNLVRGTLDLGRMKALTQLEKAQVDIVLVVEGAISDLILNAEQMGLSIEFHCQPLIPSVLGDPDKLKQVFINLLDNAIKYSPDGGIITVSIDTVSGGVQCKVIDRGDGIPAKHLSKLTQQFYRVQRDIPGNGLGLAIVDEIVRQHDGTLHIESQTEGPDKGTIFEITLPSVPVNNPT